MEGPAELLFDGIEDIAFLPDGGLAVLNRYSQEVRLFNGDGSFGGVLGGKGEGPGEFRDPIQVTLIGSDSLSAWDWGLNRVTVFPLSGGAPRTVRLDPPPPNPTGHFGVSRRVFIVGSHDVQPLGQPGEEEGQQWLNALGYGEGGQLRDTVEVLPYGQYLWVDESSREAGYPHFGARGTFSVRMNRMFMGNGSDPMVRVVDPGREHPPRQFEWAPPDRRISSRDVAATREFDFARFSQPALQQRIRRNWEALPIADRFPAMQKVLADDIGRVWVKRYPRVADGNLIWWLFDSGGSFSMRADDRGRVSAVRVPRRNRRGSNTRRS
jgi:hypothetical protein